MALVSCPECSKDVSSTVANCVHCGFELSNKKSDKRKQSKKKGSFLQSTFELVCGIAVTLVLVGIFTDTPEEAAAKEAREVQRDATRQRMEKFGDNIRAGTSIEKFVKAQLAYPQTADFPFMGGEVVEIEDGVYLQRSYVDAKNGFGVEVRFQYACRVRFNGDGYDVLSCPISKRDKTGQAQQKEI